MKKSLCVIISLAVALSLHAQKKTFSVDDNFPGGNIVVESVKGDSVFLHQDLFETVGNWFYWSFRVKGAAGRTLTFQFTHPWGPGVPRLNVIGLKGPGMSRDGGRTWKWMGMESVKGNSFKHTFLKDQSEILFSFGMPYTEANLYQFLEPYKGNLNLNTGNLALTKAGRKVERIHLGKIYGEPKYRIVLTARHHACEMMTNYVIEGLIRFVLEDNTEGKWLRENVEIMIIPFVDKDGVEDGDQGKLRFGRDHNRDYSDASIYASTQALRNFLPVWSKGKLVAALDLHCPYIRGAAHERVHQVGHRVDSIWQQQVRFSEYFQNTTRQSPISYYSASDLKFGKSWNIDANYSSGKSFTSWVSEFKGIKLASTIEFPYALASGKTVDQETLRIMGKDLSRALFNYLEAVK